MGPMIIGILLILAVLTALIISLYNELVRARERVNNSRSQIAVQVESRWDALKSLISATKKYSEYEASTLENTIKQRHNLKSDDTTVEDIEESEEQFKSAISRLIAVSEAYPDLKASEVYKTTMNNIDKYENQVRLSRMVYNDTVTKFNETILKFPNNIIANMFNFKKEEYFKNNKEEKMEMPEW